MQNKQIYVQQECADKRGADLSRRTVMYQMQSLSFRDISNCFTVFPSILILYQISCNTKSNCPKDFRPLVYFTNYLKRGYYPFVLEDDFDVRLQQIINHTLESEIAAILSASRNNIEDYSLYIEEAG